MNDDTPQGKVLKYAGNALMLGLGAGVVAAGAYLCNRISEKQNMESTLLHLEQMIEELSKTDEKS